MERPAPLFVCKRTMKNNWLNDCKKDYYSQTGEDGVIEKILEVIQPEDKWCVEFGAWDGVHLSNAYHLIKQHLFKAVLIEGDKEKYSELVKNMAEYDGVSCLNKFVSFSGKDSLEYLLAQTDIPHDFSLLSIDIDGNDYYIWESLSSYTPKLVVIEFNASIPNEVEFVQQKDMSISQGASPASLVELGRKKGYELVAATMTNLFFVDKKYFSLFEISDNSLKNIRDDYSVVTHIFNGYDGTVFIRGHKQLYLYSMPYLEKRMQLMPKWLRGWAVQSRGKRFMQRIHRSIKKRGII
ncbi:MAG: hypothetical protein BMS9Abin19_1055 [Gammaproteobacteria bacterium]|nr:MAG: hypothetical protein BMS9Abin19_1055 [Gammaproteobacteria bacterium]